MLQLASLPVLCILDWCLQTSCTDMNHCMTLIFFRLADIMLFFVACASLWSIPKWL